MSDDDDLRINTLHRFAKHSPRLTLQEYSHCEVPAGCGGVVLRWVDPTAGASVGIHVFTIGQAETWLDGKALATSFTAITPGPHILAFHLTGLGTTTPAPVGISLTPDLGRRGRSTNRLPDAYPLIERWAPGPQAIPPIGADFDDRAWDPPPHADARTFANLDDRRRRWFERLDADGTTILSLSHRPRLDEAWVRIRFAIDVRLLGDGGAR